MKYKNVALFALAMIASNVWAAAAPWVGRTLDGLACNGGGQGFGPYDYTNILHKKTSLKIVETYHFTLDVENLIKGQSGPLESDLNYTLRAWPNHHRALVSIIKYQLKINQKFVPGKLETPPECYLQRAIHFSPEDAISYSLYAYYLKEIGQTDNAATLYQKALAISPNNSKIEYAYSKFLLEIKQYDKALEYAKKAYAHGKPANALKEQLIKLGVWKLPK